MDDLEAMETIEGNDQNEAIELALDEEMDFNQQVFSHMFDIRNRTSPSSSVDSLPALHQQAKLLFHPTHNQVIVLVIPIITDHQFFKQSIHSSLVLESSKNDIFYW